MTLNACPVLWVHQGSPELREKGEVEMSNENNELNQCNENEDSDGLMSRDDLEDGLARLNAETDQLFELMQAECTDDENPNLRLACEYGRRMYTLKVWSQAYGDMHDEDEPEEIKAMWVEIKRLESDTNWLLMGMLERDYVMPDEAVLYTTKMLELARLQCDCDAAADEQCRERQSKRPNSPVKA